MFLIVSGGDHPGNAILQQRAEQAHMIIAADKGADYCLHAGVIPDLVVGDMDSVSSEVLDELGRHTVELMKFSVDKDRTDTQIALEEAIKRNAGVVEILSATGDRFDHTLANIHLLFHALCHNVEAYIITCTQKIFLINSHHTLQGCKGQTMSFLPLSMMVKGISLNGFAYELADASMDIGTPYGISNMVTADEAFIKVREGILIAILLDKV